MTKTKLKSTIKIICLTFFLGFVSVHFLSAQNLSDKEQQREQRVNFLFEKYKEEFGPHEKEHIGNPSPNIATIRGDGEEIKVTDFNGNNVTESEPSIAVNPTNPDNIVVSFIHRKPDLSPLPDTKDGMSTYYSFDGGATWDRSNFDFGDIYFGDNSPDTTYWSLAGGADPVYAFDKNGKLYCVWLYGLTKGLPAPGFTVATYWGWSDDGGANFQVADEKEDRLLGAGTLDPLFAGSTGTIVDRPWLAVDKSDGPLSGSVYIQAGILSGQDPGGPFASIFSGSGIVRKRPTMDGFESLNESSLENIVPHISDNNYGTQHGHIYVDHQGALHSTFVGLEDGALFKHVYHLISYDGSQTFTSLSPIADGETNDINQTLFRENPLPNAVSNPITGNIHVVFTTASTDPTDNNRYGQYLKSTDNGSTWSPVQDIATMLGANATSMVYPTIASDDISGRISIAYLGLDNNNEWNYFVSSSIDDGVTWDEPCKLTTTPTNFDDYPEAVFFGDYWETKMVQDKTYCVWTDGRNMAGAKIYTAVIDHTEVTNVSEISPLTDQFKILGLSPNPTSGEIKLSIYSEESGNINIELFSIDGNILFPLQKENTPAGELDIQINLPDNISAGTYIIKVNTAYGVFTKKLVLID